MFLYEKSSFYPKNDIILYRDNRNLSNSILRGLVNA